MKPVVYLPFTAWDSEKWGVAKRMISIKFCHTPAPGAGAGGDH